mmetsp:Transcript_20373/g.29847  ORF Transcript_20373/g.29847 Transcript_20373/m.29847 type:complete len:205 (+) Transcript_20373:266-880(+)
MEYSIINQDSPIINGKIQSWYYPKLLSMFTLTLLDLGINSSLDYDDFKSSLSSTIDTESSTTATITSITNKTEQKQFLDIPDDNTSTDDYITNNQDRLKNIHVLLFGLQVLCQISIFSTWFLLVCETFPFQVGLLGVLAEEYIFFLLLYILYLVLTCIVGGLRLAVMHENFRAYDLWMHPHYAALSSIHKLGQYKGFACQNIFH